jgi:hypothetical protein
LSPMCDAPTPCERITEGTEIEGKRVPAFVKRGKNGASTGL